MLVKDLVPLITKQEATIIMNSLTRKNLIKVTRDSTGIIHYTLEDLLVALLKYIIPMTQTRLQSKTAKIAKTLLLNYDINPEDKKLIKLYTPPIKTIKYSGSISTSYLSQITEGKHEVKTVSVFFIHLKSLNFLEHKEIHDSLRKNAYSYSIKEVETALMRYIDYAKGIPAKDTKRQLAQDLLFSLQTSPYIQRSEV